MALEYIEESGGNEIAELIRVEWLGQDVVDTGAVDDDGNQIYELQPFQTGVDADGNPIYLTRIAT
jgi:hypothetical protein